MKQEELDALTPEEIDQLFRQSNRTEAEVADDLIAQQVGEKYVRQHEDYRPTPENARLIDRYMKALGFPKTAEYIDIAVQSLRDQGVLQEWD